MARPRPVIPVLLAATILLFVGFAEAGQHVE